jgi:hypothetical protein
MFLNHGCAFLHVKYDVKIHNYIYEVKNRLISGVLAIIQ